MTNESLNSRGNLQLWQLYVIDFSVPVKKEVQDEEMLVDESERRAKEIASEIAKSHQGEDEK